MTECKAKRQDYKAPRVTEFGKVVDLTASGTKTSAETGQGNMP
jgi:hypothetical protein